jgi:hypothetical protein
MFLFADSGKGAVHGLGYLVGRVASQILLQRVAEQAASRAIGAPGKAFRTLKDFIGDGHSGFHTLSITRRKTQGKAMFELAGDGFGDVSIRHIGAAVEEAAGG